MNGLLYGNLNGLTMCIADRVAWHVLGLGTEVDIHSLTFNGQTVSVTENRVQSVSILPGTFKTLHMTPDNVGKLEFVLAHIEESDKFRAKQCVCVIAKFILHYVSCRLWKAWILYYMCMLSLLQSNTIEYDIILINNFTTSLHVNVLLIFHLKESICKIK